MSDAAADPDEGWRDPAATGSEPAGIELDAGEADADDEASDPVDRDLGSGA